MKLISSRISITFSWQTLFLGTAGAAFGYAFLEWLFIITKPSLLSMLPFVQKIRILLLSFSLISSLSLLILLILFALSIGLRIPWLKSFGIIVPAGITASLALLLFDNFTYTLLGVGISTSQGYQKAAYLVLFLWLVGYFLVNWPSVLAKLEPKSPLLRRWFIPSLVLVIVIAGIVGYMPPAKIERPEFDDQRNSNWKTPHILLITADGLDADHTSVYGYERDTTPFLRQLAEHSLVAENAFSNSANTAGSIVSILTGRYPTTTRVIYHPHTLQNNDVYKHLPYILRINGYKSIQYSHPYYVDAFALGIREGFDYVNESNIQESPMYTSLKNFFDFRIANYIYQILNRITDRLQHIFFMKEMTDFQQLIPDGRINTIPDIQKVDSVLRALIDSEQAMFIHLHWMGTHGPKYYPKKQVFSKGKNLENQEEWDIDFYDDSILDFDTAVARVVNELEDNDLIDHTILVITSDHGMRWSNLKRIPLIIHFPYDGHKGKIMSNVQLIDIHPTLLDYLGISQPIWLEGHSLIQKETAIYPIFGAGVYKTKINEDGTFVIVNIRPPFYGFQVVSLISCDTWYRLDLSMRVWEKGTIEGTNPACEPYADIEAFRLLIKHLEDRGFDTSSIRDFSLIKKQ